MSLPEGTSREALYQNWLDWVTANLGRDSKLAGVAATAATDAAQHGRGFNSAVESAKAAWKEAAQVEAATAAPTESGVIDHARTERRALIACACGIAAWLWPILTVVLWVKVLLRNLVMLGLNQFDWVSAATVAIAVLSIAAIPAFPLVAILCGHSGRRRIKRFRLRGNSFATAGLVLGYPVLLGSPLLIGLVLFVSYAALMFGTTDVGF